MSADESLTACLNAAHMKLTELGEWMRDNPGRSSLDLSALSAADALACDIASFTDHGREYNSRRIAELRRELGMDKPQRSWWSRVKGWIG